MKQETYLEMTYRRGKPMAGYIYLPGRDGDRVIRSAEAEAGLVIDYAEDGRAIGIEIVSPSLVSLEAINKLMAKLHLQNMSKEELAPLLAS